MEPFEPFVWWRLSRPYRTPIPNPVFSLPLDGGLSPQARDPSAPLGSTGVRAGVDHSHIGCLCLQAYECN